MVVLAIPVVMFVNPIQRGFADLRDGQAAKHVRATAADVRGEELWVSDDIYVDALLMANSRSSLSGQQWVGPDEGAWKVLDPYELERETWNRGAAYIAFRWGDEGRAPAITLASADMVIVEVDPCHAALRRLDVRVLVASRELNADCLTRRDTFAFGGGQRWVYDVT